MFERQLVRESVAHPIDCSSLSNVWLTTVPLAQPLGDYIKKAMNVELSSHTKSLPGKVATAAKAAVAMGADAGRS